MIYQGTEANTHYYVTEIQTSSFNRSNDNNMYVGYMYESNQVHGLTSNSTIKGILDTWYQNNLSNVYSKIDGNAGFCGDRQPSTSNTISNGLGGTGTTYTFYGAYIRLDTNKAPTYECASDSDLYTTIGSENGNGALTYPIGLITADEVMLAGNMGGFFDGAYNYQKETPNSYITTGDYFWTMTPSGYYNTLGSSSWDAVPFSVSYTGKLNDSSTYFEMGLRPVINIRNDVTVTGEGTMQNPYKFN